ncbi:MAG TPA: cytochrome c peroxidase [Candidatus Binatia bacterium]|nr:cytochrome c peroxidase [Candidatus Binatia bacterium]
MRRSLLVAATLALLVGVAAAAEDPPRPPSLKTVAVPGPTNLDDFVRDRDALLVLGKALFWDMQVGSDGRTACASCHFHAGADSRSKNQLDPGTRGVTPDTTFAAHLGPNHQLVPDDFPLSPFTNDVVGSQGVTRFGFDGWTGRPRERLVAIPDPNGFRSGGVNVRQVVGRNAPSVINAVFNHRQFWDGRAQNVFNGVNGLGDDDPAARVYRADDSDLPVPVRIRLEDSSLASQAVMPVGSAVEMAAEGRDTRHVSGKFLRGRQELGRRVRRLRPLAEQQVHRDDSVLGASSRYPAPGLRITRYDTLIARAFRPEWWRSRRRLRLHPDGTVDVVRRLDQDPATREYTLMQYNFALFFGLAVQAYEATLVADDSPYDRFMDGDVTAITPEAVAGVDVFRSQARGRCINCHEGAELTGASVRRVRESPTRIREGQALDRGFNNIAVVPTIDDPGVGGASEDGLPLSTVRRLDPAPPEPIAIDGAMKVPGLRNVALTAPYFHNGGQLRLIDVLSFYSRGGDVRPQHGLDGTLEIAGLNVLDNTVDELAALEAFLLSLTDARVRDRRAPFDHPQLFVPDGHVEPIVDDGNGAAVDVLREVAAVGRDGGPPLPGFLE